MSDAKMGRREAGRRFLMVLGGAALVPSALAACGGEEGADALTCTDTSALNASEIATRESQMYADHSPHADKHCNNCRFYTAGGQNACGTCQVLRGPIHPEGHCNLWAAQS
jgi:hypothetical protein